MLNVALVGVGGISAAHIPGWQALDNVRLVALCDIRPQQMEKYPDQRHYTDFDEMLQKEKIDILDICLPTYLHADFAEKAMRAGIHVLCEKPVSLHKEDVRRLYDIARENHVKFMVAQVIRFWPEYEIIKELYDSGKYGKLLSGSMKRIGCRPKWSWDDWMFDRERSGLVPFDLHIHDLDFLVWAFGKPKNVTDFRSNRANQDYINAVYEFDDFFITTEAAWFNAPYPFTVAFSFRFEKALAAWENGEMKIYEADGKTYCPISQAGEDTGDIGLPKSDAYANEIRYFANCVEQDLAPEKVQPTELEQVIEILRAL